MPFVFTFTIVLITVFCGCSARYHSVTVGDSTTRTASIRFCDDTDVGALTDTFPAPTGTTPVDTLRIGDVRSHVNVESVKAVSEGVVKGFVEGATGR